MKAVSILSTSVVAALLLAGTAEAATLSGTGTPDSNAALAGGTVIDFESTASGDYGSLTIGNVTFKGIDDTLRVTSDYAGSYNTRGRLYLENGPYDSSMAYSMRFDFAAAVSAFGFNWGAADNIWLLSAYDATDSLLGSYSLTATGPSNAGEYFGLAFGGIAYATLVNQSGDAGDYVMIDNFTYNGGGDVEVPEPTSLALFGLGLAGLVASRRKRSA